MGLKMAEFEPIPVSHFFSAKPDLAPHDCPFVPYWARSHVQCAQNLLPTSNEPIEYDDDDEDFQDNCFFFPEDCSYTPPKNWVVETQRQSVKNTTEDQVEVKTPAAQSTTDTMLPELPDIKMLDSEALGDLLEDNLCPPEITTMLYGFPPTVPLFRVDGSWLIVDVVSSQPMAQSSPMLPPSHPVNSGISAQPTVPHTHVTPRPPLVETSLV